MKKLLITILFTSLFSENLLIGVTMKKPIEEMINKVKTNFPNSNITAHYGSSGAYLSEILLKDDADLYLPGSDSYVKKLPPSKIIKKQLIGYNQLVLVVKKGNPKHIYSINDLFRKDVKVGIGAPRLSSVGNYTYKILLKYLGKKRLNELLSKSSLGTQSRQLNSKLRHNFVDVIINWKGAVIAYKPLKDKYEIIPIPENIAPKKKLVLVQLKNTPFDNAFFKFATSKEGLDIMKKWGF